MSTTTRISISKPLPDHRPQQQPYKFTLTSIFLLIACDSLEYITVEIAIKYYWELKAIDSIISRYRELPPKECQHIIDNIIDNDEIKEMLVSKNSYNKSTSTALANTAYQQTH